MQALWPAPGESYTFDAGKLTYLGVDRFNPLFLNCRPDQQQSRWTLKLIVYTAPADSEPINLQGLAQLESVQELFAAVLKAGRSLIKREMNSAKWTWFAIGYLFVFAYILSFIVYQIGFLFTGGSFNVLSGLAVALLAGSLYLLFRKPRVGVFVSA